MTLEEYKDTIGKLYVQASVDLTAALTKLPARGERSRDSKYHEYQKLGVLVNELRGILEKLSGV